MKDGSCKYGSSCVFGHDVAAAACKPKSKKKKKKDKKEKKEKKKKGKAENGGVAAPAVAADEKPLNP